MTHSDSPSAFPRCAGAVQSGLARALPSAARRRRARSRTARGGFWAAFWAGALILARLQAADSAPAAPWFNDIRNGLPLSNAQTAALARQVFAAARLGRCPRDFLAEFATDTAPRAVFLTLAGPPRLRQAPGKARRSPLSALPEGHVYLGTGFGLPAAVRAAFSQAFAAPAACRPARVSGVKIDIVQYVAAPAAFLARKDTVRFPGLAGLAFGPRSRIAFLPEQLLAGVYLDAKGALRIHRIEEVLTAEHDFRELGTWNRLASFTVPQGIQRFECLSVWVDARATVPLFRGHPIAVSADTPVLRRAALALAERLIQAQTQGGRLLLPLPGWAESLNDAKPLLPQAALAYALLHLADSLGPNAAEAPRLRRAGNAILTRLLKRFQETPRIPGGKAVAEIDRFRVETNAWVTLALLERYDRDRTREDLARITGLGRFLIAQLQPDGSLVLERYADTGDIRATPESPAISGLAILALTRLYESTGYTACLHVAAAAMNYILHDRFLKTDMAKIPLSDDLACAMNELFTFTRDRRLLTQAERLGLAIQTRQDRDPATLDLLGGDLADPSAATAAARARALVAMAALLGDNRRTDAAADLLSTARLTFLYLMRLRFRHSVLLYVAHPENYRNLFREDLSAFQCTLPTQLRVLLALTSALEWTRDSGKAGFPLTKTDARLLDKMHHRLRRFPRVLDRLPPPAADSAAPENRLDEGGIPVINAVPKRRR